MKLSRKYLGLVTLSILTVACSSSSFSGTAAKRTGTQAPSGTAGPNERDGNANPKPTGPVAADDNGGTLGRRSKDILPSPDQVQVLCSSRNAKILILDFKSGWFAGDGGDFYKTFVNPECRSKIDISYVHVTQQVVESNFGASPAIASVMPCITTDDPLILNAVRSLDKTCAFKTPSDYDQVWILSGSEADGEDVRLNSSFFESVLVGLKAHHLEKPKTSYFFSAGLGNSDHSNAVSKSLFNNSIFGPNPISQQGFFPSVEIARAISSEALVQGSGLEPGTFDSSAVLFGGLQTLEDYKRGMLHTAKGESFDCLTDPIVSMSMTALATDACGRVAIAAAKFAESRVVAEGNTSRFYKTKPEEYFHRIIAMLLAP